MYIRLNITPYIKRLLCSGIKRLRRGVNNARPSSDEVKERVEQYLYSLSLSLSGLSWPALGRPLPLPLQKITRIIYTQICVSALTSASSVSFFFDSLRMSLLVPSTLILLSLLPLFRFLQFIVYSFLFAFLSFFYTHHNKRPWNQKAHLCNFCTHGCWTPPIINIKLGKQKS